MAPLSEHEEAWAQFVSQAHDQTKLVYPPEEVRRTVDRPTGTWSDPIRGSE